MPNDDLTIGQLSAELTRNCPAPVPTWKARKVVDAVGGQVRRVGLYRLVPRSLIPAIVEELERTGWFDREDVPCA
jgi:hypothetical protein